ncbi:MAG: 23S rRNA (pseudouridine(1915)-N(3))-methyltransferase RlmH [Patescibacteria group bacterium]|jgi:23S rRNA (pseudouridine1915-N3)-methyltransferase
MQKIILRAIGKASEDWHAEAIRMYLERLKPLASLDLIELPEGHGGSAKPDLAKTRRIEAESLMKGVPDGAFVIALDETGKQFDSTTFSKKMETWSEGGRALVFLIGGSWGLDETVRQKADAIFSLGSITLPHQLARIVLLEQLYRATMIERGTPYHK